MGKKGKGNGGGGGGGKAPIFAAIDAEDVSALTALLAASGAALEARNGDGWTPLIAAAYVGSSVLVDVLLRAGADVNASCADGCTALHYASAQGSADAIRRLAAAPGIRLVVEDRDGETASDVAQGKKIKALIATLVAEAEAVADRGSSGDDDDGDDGGGGGGGE